MIGLDGALAGRPACNLLRPLVRVLGRVDSQQYWQQSRRVGLDPRPSAFQAGHIPSWRGSRKRYALSLAAAACHWSPLLLSLLLSASICERRGSVLAI